MIKFKILSQNNILDKK